MKPRFWVIKCDTTGTILGTNGKWYNMTPVEYIKKYKNEGNAIRRLTKLQSHYSGYTFTAYAVHKDQTIDCCGEIEKVGQ
tara:strand:- start:994 stop:1233 length:240 start_codon:yes stop_codon:yes gene_type:complete